MDTSASNGYIIPSVPGIESKTGRDAIEFTVQPASGHPDDTAAFITECSRIPQEPEKTPVIDPDTDLGKNLPGFDIDSRDVFGPEGSEPGITHA